MKIQIDCSNTVKKIKLIVIVFLMLFFAQCSDKTDLSITNLNFEEEIELQQQLVFTFDQDLASDTMLNSWKKDGYISFTPNIEGKFKWISKNELAFSPNNRFEPSTDYEARFSTELGKLTKSKKVDTKSIIAKFHTPYLKLNDLAILWAKSKEYQLKNEIRISGSFNYPIDVLDLKAKLSVAIADKITDFQFTPLDNGSGFQITIIEEGNFDDKKLLLSIAQGLKFADGIHSGKTKLEHQTSIPSKDNFQIISAEPMYQDTSAFIEVITNQELLKYQDYNQLININPSVLNKKIELTETGFLIHGVFTVGQSYQLNISNELKGIFEGKLNNDFEQLVVFGEQKPNISFVNKNAIYLTSKGNKELGIRVINVPKVKVVLYKIYANNIATFLRTSGLLNNYYDYGYEDDYYVGEIENYGDVVYQKDINTSSLKTSNGVSLVNLDFNDINTLNGIYVVSVFSDEDTWLRSSKLICISDVGLIAKETETELLVFANSLINTNPLQGVELSLMSSNNQEMLKSTTDKDGVARFDKSKSVAPNFVAQMIMAKYQSEFTYLHFDQGRVENSRFDVGGLRNNTSGFQAYIYGDREIYRPGENININVILRNNHWEALINAPLKVKLILPNGKELMVKNGILNKEGALAMSFPLQTSAITGTYLLEVYSGNDVLLNSKSISVEEFMPDRIKVATTLNKTEYQLQDQLQVNTSAYNFFGPPASNRNYEMELSLVRKEFTSINFPDFDFSLFGNLKTDFVNDLRQGQTDSEGKAIQNFQFSPTFAYSGLLQGKLLSTVFDESGRPVHNVKRFDVFTQNVFIGAKISDSYVATQQPMNIQVLAIDKNQKKVNNCKAVLEIIKYDWQTVLEKDYGTYRYISQKKVKSLVKKSIQITDNYNYSYLPLLSGEYELRISFPNTESYVSKIFYAYGWGATNSNSFEVNKEGTVDIILDKKVYAKGDKANILLKSPFPGKVLITVERDKVFKHFILNTDNRSAHLELEIVEEYLPNVYITATVIKPASDNNIPLTVAHGFAPLMVEDKEYQLPITINAPLSSRSNVKQKISIHIPEKKEVEFTLAVVDEGILQLKNTPSPDPYQFFFQKRALEVNAYDLYAKLLPEFRKISTGGDGYNIEKRINPMSNKRVKPAVFWSGQLKTDDKGNASIEVPIPPAFSGDLRIMCVAYKGKSFGAKTVNMKVADPIVISTSLPRFLSPQDSLSVNVTISNTTSKPINGTFQFNASGMLKLSNSAHSKISIAPNSELQLQFAAVAPDKVGDINFSSQVNTSSETFIEKNTLTIRPPTSLTKVSLSGMVSAGKKISIPIVNDFISSSFDSKLIVSKSPLVQFSQNLDNLVEYPHGCLEQTVSKAFPLLYFSDIVKSLNLSSRVSSSNVDYNIQEAINKLQAMQLPSGGLSYWLGGYEESWWASIYAAHFLVEAKKAGYEVNSKLQDKLYHFLQQKLSLKSTETLFYSDASNQIKQKKIAAKELFYSMYVLAIAGRQDLPLMNYYKSNTNLLSLDSRYLLAGTYQLLGDHSSSRKLMPNNFEGEKSITALGGSYYSYIRDMAISLNTILETEPSNPQVGILARHLSQQLKASPYLSTQQLAFSLIALGKLARHSTNKEAKGTVLCAGKTIAKYETGELLIKNNSLKGDITVYASEGDLYYFYQAEGIPKGNKIKEEDNFIKVRRTFLDRNGQAINSNVFKQNDLIFVKLSLSTLDQSAVENVVVTDILPAGFEIENPRLTDLNDMPWLAKQSQAQHMDYRDDRINLFTTATGDTKEFYYSVRAVSKGKFTLGTVNADAMYNGEYHSYHGAGAIIIK